MQTTNRLHFFQHIDNQLYLALETNSAGVIAPLLANDWTLLDPLFGITPKNKFLAAIADGRLVHTRMQKTVVQVKAFGKVALVTSRGPNKGKYLGQLFDAVHWVTNLYQLTGGTWLCVATQEMPVSCG